MHELHAQEHDVFVTPDVIVTAVAWKKKREQHRVERGQNASILGEYGDEAAGEDEAAEEEADFDALPALNKCGRCGYMVPRGHNAGNCQYAPPVKKQRREETDSTLEDS